MKIRIRANPKAEHQYVTAQNLVSGFNAHGLADVKIVSNLEERCDLAVFWGVKSLPSIRGKLAKDCLIMERSYFHDRYQDISLGFNGLNGRADFCLDNSAITSERFERKYVDQLLDWNTQNQKAYTLITAQCLNDQSLMIPFEQPSNVLREYQRIIKEARRFSPVPLAVKHHPIKPLCIHATARRLFQGIQEIPHDMPIAKVFANAYAVVTINSNSGVEALLAGVPVLNTDEGAMSWEVAIQNKFICLCNIRKNLTQFDRHSWAVKLAYCQWSQDEIASGEAWNHLKWKYEKSYCSRASNPPPVE